MLAKILPLIRNPFKMPKLGIFPPRPNKRRPPKINRLSHTDCRFVRKVIDSCKLEVQISSAIEWIHRLYRRGALTAEPYHELIHHAIYKEEEIITEQARKNLVLPYLQKRAAEIVEEERRRKIRIVKAEAKIEA